MIKFSRSHAPWKTSSVARFLKFWITSYHNFELRTIPFSWFAFLGLILAFMLTGLLLAYRLRRNPPTRAESEPLTARRLVLGAARLAGFGLLSLTLMGGGLMAYVNLHAVDSEIAPARLAVELPPDLPFALEQVSFSGADGVRLAGWFTPARNGVTIILLHGYGGTRASMLWYAEELVQAGYGVLIYDERASGESGGERRSFGWEDGLDVGGALAFLRQQYAGQAFLVGAAGCSMGAQIALQGAILFPEIGAVWADGSAIIRAADNPPPHNLVAGVVTLSNYMIDEMYIWKFGLPAPAPLIARIGQIAPRPIMLVAGGVEQGLLGSEARRIENFAAYAGANAQVWVIKEADPLRWPPKAPGGVCP